MVGTRKKESGSKRNLKFDEMEEGHSNGKQTEGGSKRAKITGSRKSPKVKTSPRKLAKPRRKNPKSNAEAVRVTFEEENDRVTLKIEGIDKNFPEPPEVGREDDNSQGSQQSRNNNATVVTNKAGPKGGKENRRKASPSRADRFREMVSTASSTMGDEMMEEETNESFVREEGETRTSEEEEDDDNASDTSSVKILRRSKEELEKEEEEFRQARDELIDTAVNKTMEKLTQFMRNSGVVFSRPEKGNPPGKNPVKGKHVVKSNKNKDVTHARDNHFSADNSSVTTIYDNALNQNFVQNNEDENNSGRNRISTSSEELGDTSDEMIESLVNNLVIPGRQDSQDESQDDMDEFYEQAPQPGCSTTRPDNRPQPRKRDKRRQWEDEARQKA